MSRKIFDTLEPQARQEESLPVNPYRAHLGVVDGMTKVARKLSNIDERLARNNMRALLINWCGKVLARGSKEKERKTLPDARIVIMTLDPGKENVRVDGVDTFRRHEYRGNWQLEYERTSEKFPYWRNRQMTLPVTLPKIDTLDLPPGLHVPDEVFLIRMDARQRLLDPEYLNNCRLPGVHNVGRIVIQSLIWN